MPVRLRAIAHSRTGDKGDISNIAVIAYDRNTIIGWSGTLRRKGSRRTSPTSSLAMSCAMRCPASGP